MIYEHCVYLWTLARRGVWIFKTHYGPMVPCDIVLLDTALCPPRASFISSPPQKMSPWQNDPKLREESWCHISLLLCDYFLRSKNYSMHHIEYSHHEKNITFGSRVKPACLIRFAERGSQIRDNKPKIGTTNPNQGPENGEAGQWLKTGKSNNTSPFFPFFERICILRPKGFDRFFFRQKWHINNTRPTFFLWRAEMEGRTSKKNGRHFSSIAKRVPKPVHFNGLIEVKK